MLHKNTRGYRVLKLVVFLEICENLYVSIYGKRMFGSRRGAQIGDTSSWSKMIEETARKGEIMPSYDLKEQSGFL